jgi:hypothetical protein
MMTESPFTKIILTFQGTTTLFTTNHQQKVTEELKELFKFLSTTVNAHFSSPKRWYVNRVMPSWKMNKIFIKQMLLGHLHNKTGK